MSPLTSLRGLLGATCRTPLLRIPRCNGRYQPPGTLHRPHNERFDENCDPIPPPHPETPRFVDALTPGPKPKGRIADKRPFHMVCEPDRVYWWCSCGHSAQQPFCDGHHHQLIGPTAHFKIARTQFKPIRLTFERKTEVWFCMCKQTNQPPYCDGSHNCEEVQSAIKF